MIKIKALSEAFKMNKVSAIFVNQPLTSWRLLIREDFTERWGRRSIQLRLGVNIFGDREIYVFPNSVILYDHSITGTSINGNIIYNEDIDLFEGDIIEFARTIFMITRDEVEAAVELN